MLMNWEEPLELEEAFIRRRVLIAEIQDIQAQLGDPRKKATFVDREGFLAWRQSAKWAMTNKLQELRLVKDWVRDRYVHEVVS